GRGAKGDEEGVALRVHDAALMGGERCVEQPRVLGQHLVIVVATQVLQESCGALDVCEQEGDGPARELAHVQERTPENGTGRAGVPCGASAALLLPRRLCRP